LPELISLPIIAPQMPKISQKSAAASPPLSPVPVTPSNKIKSNKVEIRFQLDNDGNNSIYKRLLTAKRALGITETNIVRLAVATFLDKNGF
jgi:hypothetical protein